MEGSFHMQSTGTQTARIQNQELPQFPLLPIEYNMHSFLKTWSEHKPFNHTSVCPLGSRSRGGWQDCAPLFWLKAVYTLHMLLFKWLSFLRFLQQFPFLSFLCFLPSLPLFPLSALLSFLSFLSYFTVSHYDTTWASCQLIFLSVPLKC